MTSSGYTPADLARRIEEPAKSALLPGAAAVGGRSAFARDRARVLHSGSFRRLAGKTQVVAPGGLELIGTGLVGPADQAGGRDLSDEDVDLVPRTRLTHSLEVAQLAREIGAQLGCDPDLVDLAGLAHDIGHPPFGHNGEAALDAVAGDAGGFEANAQNLRLLARLEPKVVDDAGRPGGLNLTRAGLDSVIKYPWVRPPGGGKFGVYEVDRELFAWVRRGVPAPTARSLESQVMDWADDVAYSVHDVEDGITAGRIDLAALRDPQERAALAEAAATGFSAESADDLATVLADLLDLPVVRAALAASMAAGRGTPDATVAAAAVKQMTSELTGRLATGPILATREITGPDPLTRYDADLVVPRRLRAEVAVLKAMAVRYVMADPRRLAAQRHEQELLAELVGELVRRGPEALDPAFRPAAAAAGSDADWLRVVLDQVSLLTDAQAVVRHRRFCR
ncbi:deoxyguanosinetriphosphate triphosphohydrolase [Nakamurella leprariae]|uniref:Deoxyguanosinetriphosphate triphosphohydrolase n=1 Tax=Nakamurella leprariae TaxID=2803911 RepID=A0A938YBM4_9ACTN|nr:deoxyguanosinetriphosphate triphosphohydrolase [Nakamurella leprariae]MBM9469515.1 deoxyguanosinetriphosphate triphosphohydrolase [Nakamurella leprariae]